MYIKQLHLLLADPSKNSSTIDPQLLSKALSQFQLWHYSRIDPLIHYWLID